jgi:hypothetical protein
MDMPPPTGVRGINTGDRSLITQYTVPTTQQSIQNAQASTLTIQRPAATTWNGYLVDHITTSIRNTVATYGNHLSIYFHRAHRYLTSYVIDAVRVTSPHIITDRVFVNHNITHQQTTTQPHLLTPPLAKPLTEPLLESSTIFTPTNLLEDLPYEILVNEVVPYLNAQQAAHLLQTNSSLSSKILQALPINALRIARTQLNINQEKYFAHITRLFWSHVHHHNFSQEDVTSMKSTFLRAISARFHHIVSPTTTLNINIIPQHTHCLQSIIFTLPAEDKATLTQLIPHFENIIKQLSIPPARPSASRRTQASIRTHSPTNAHILRYSPQGYLLPILITQSIFASTYTLTAAYTNLLKAQTLHTSTNHYLNTLKNNHFSALQKTIKLNRIQIAYNNILLQTITEKKLRQLITLILKLIAAQAVLRSLKAFNNGLEEHTLRKNKSLTINHSYCTPSLHTSTPSLSSTTQQNIAHLIHSNNMQRNLLSWARMLRDELLRSRVLKPIAHKLYSDTLQNNYLDVALSIKAPNLCPQTLQPIAKHLKSPNAIAYWLTYIPFNIIPLLVPFLPDTAFRQELNKLYKRKIQTFTPLTPTLETYNDLQQDPNKYNSSNQNFETILTT